MGSLGRAGWKLGTAVRLILSEFLLARMLLVALAVCGATIVHQYRGVAAVGPLVVWMPVLYTGAALVSKRRALGGRVRLSPLFLLVSRSKTIFPPTDEHGVWLGNASHSLEWDIKTMQVFARARFSFKEDENYTRKNETGSDWFAGDDGLSRLLQQKGGTEWGYLLDEQILQVRGADLNDFAQLCCEYLKARRNSYFIFAAAWVGLIYLSLTTDYISGNFVLLGLIASGVGLALRPERSVSDWTHRCLPQAVSYNLANCHVHVLACIRPAASSEASWCCQCGKRIKAGRP
jgi:hypothetical protein